MDESLIEKIKEHGIWGSFKVFLNILAGGIDRLIYNICCILPIDNDLIVFESQGDFCDNTKALFMEMLSKGYLKKYKVVWLVHHPENFKTIKYPNTIFIKYSDHICLKRMYYFARCKYCISSHYDVLSEYRKRRGRIELHTTHGMPVKGAKGDTLEHHDNLDMILATGDFYAPLQVKWFGCPLSKARITGLPRNDCFFQPDSENIKIYSQRLRLQSYKKVFLWMPTFRQSDAKALNEDNGTCKLGLPIINEEKDLNTLNDYLNDKNCLIILKIHRLQQDMPVFSKKFSNILILKNEDLDTNNVELYELVKQANSLITDYSSISVDYLLLDRPIIYTLDDYDEYHKSRGFAYGDTKATFKGYYVYNLQDLIHAIGDIEEGKDIFKEERERWIPKAHKYVDGMAGERVIKFLGLKK